MEALAWWVFAHAMSVGFALLLMAAEKLGADVNAVRLPLEPLLGEYFRLFRDSERAIAFPIAGWFVLWLFTGSPRILPWKRPEQTEEL